MSATFREAVRYAVRATCLSPIRTGGTGLTAEQILRDAAGKPYFHGASLAGALREHCRLAFGKDAAEALFGSQKASGHLVISDGSFPENSATELRPRLRINGKTGTADPHGKFDVAHLPVGTELTFTITWMGFPEDAHQLTQVEQLLSALHHGQIRLGGQKTNGFGRVQLEVRRQIYHLSDAHDRQCWLEELDEAVPMTLPAVEQAKQLTFVVEGEADSILVKSGNIERRNDRNVTVPIREQGVSIVPGSSVKGSLRNRVALIGQMLGKPEVADNLFGRMNNGEDNGVAGRVIVDDVRLSDAKSMEISRIHINRFTGGVIRNGLFTEEPLQSPVTLRLSLLEAPETQETHESQESDGGYLLYALRDLGLGLWNLGSGASVGRGYIRVHTITVTHSDGRTGVLRFDGQRRCTMEDSDGILEKLCEQAKGDGQ